MEVGRFQELFRPFLAGAGERDKVFCCRLALFVFEDFKSPASDLHDLIFVFVDCDFGKELFYVNGGAVVLLERLVFSWLWCTAMSSSTRAFTPWGSFSTRTAARRCCWNVEALAFVESFDVNGGAVVLLERRCASCWWAATMSTSTRAATLGRSFTDANGGAVAAAGTSRSAFGWSRST